MKIQVTFLVIAISFILALMLTTSCDAHGRQKRSPDKYDDHYDKFITRHFADVNGKFVDEKDEYKSASAESADEEGGSHEAEEEEEESNDGDSKSDITADHDFSYGNHNDYDRIKALSEKQVEELHKKPGNCKHFEKDGMVCAECKDPDTGDTSESCAFSSQPNDKKVAYLSKKSHNYKTQPQVEATESGDDTSESDDEESEDEEEKAVNPPPSGPKPLKQHKSEQEDASDFGAYRLAGYSSDIDEYDEPKFAHYITAKGNKPRSEKLTESLPTSSNYNSNQFQSRNLNQALTDFSTKDWTNCRKVMKGELTCYYCVDVKGVNQEECMYVSSSNPKSIKLERHESKNYDIDSRRPSPTFPTIISTTLGHSAPLKVAPVVPDKRERFARLRMGRPLVPTRATKEETAEPLVTPKTSLDYFGGDLSNPSSSNFKKTIKRTIINKKKKHFDDYLPAESRAIAFESHVMHKNY